jgi:hypothetical protein
MISPAKFNSIKLKNIQLTFLKVSYTKKKSRFAKYSGLTAATFSLMGKDTGMEEISSLFILNSKRILNFYLQIGPTATILLNFRKTQTT